MPVRAEILLCFQEHDTGFDPAPPVWKTDMQPITPIVRRGEKVPVSSPLIQLKCASGFLPITPAGFEPVFSGLKGRYPLLLDEGALMPCVRVERTPPGLQPGASTELAYKA